MSIAENLARVRERIAEAALRAGRDPTQVTLVAVTKTRSVGEIVIAYEEGVRHFGENRPEEGSAKIPAVAAALAGERPVWHMIGHIQSRKARAVVADFDYIHSVDRVKIARRLSRFAQEAGRLLPVLLECNISGERTKFGFDLYGWEDDEEQQARFFAAVRQIMGLPGLTVQGLMTMAPLTDEPETVRPVFAGLRRLLDALREHFPTGEWRHLSMGMSDDFVVAVEEGATLVRIGRAIFAPEGK